MFQENVYRALSVEAMAKAEQFKTHLKRLGYSKGTQQMLPACVAEFLSCLEEKNIREPYQIKPEHIQQHYEYLTQRPNKRKPGGLSSQMIHHHIYAIRKFLDYQEQIGNITENPISSLIFPRPESKQREILTVQEIKQLYEVSETYTERAIIGMFYGCGLRKSEGVALNIKDISFKSSLLYVREGKGKKRRVVPINEKVKDDFKNYYYKERSIYITNRTTKPENTQSFILSSQGNRMCASTYNRKLKSLITKAGIQKEISLHCLRHSIATHLLENGLSVEYVRDFLGHKHLESTQIYTRVSQKKLSSL